MTEFNSIIGVSWLIFVVYWLVSAAQSKRNVSSGFRRFAGARIAMLVVAVVVLRVTAGHHLLQDMSTALLVIGGIMFFAGLALAIWARVHLGRNSGMPMSKKENPELVTTGPYRFIRHPIYTGMLLAMIGSAAGNVYWLLVFVVSGVYFVYSARQEEKLMAQEFPEEYPSYMCRTKMLMPFVL